MITVHLPSAVHRALERAAVKQGITPSALTSGGAAAPAFRALFPADLPFGAAITAPQTRVRRTAARPGTASGPTGYLELHDHGERHEQGRPVGRRAGADITVVTSVGSPPPQLARFFAITSC